MIDFPDLILSDPRAAEFSAGTATHWLRRWPGSTDQLRDHFPAKDIWLTECSGGEWQKGNLLVAQASLIIETTRNWGRALFCGILRSIRITDRILAVAPTAGLSLPSTTPHRQQPSSHGDFTALAHASKFVAPGALRIDSSSSEESPIEHVPSATPMAQSLC